MTMVAVSCLVLVDLQAAFVTGPDAVPGAVVLLAAATDLLDRARQARSLVVHLQNDGPPGAVDEPGTPGWALYVKPRASTGVDHRQRPGIGAWSRATPPSIRRRCGLVRWIGETVRVGVAHGLRAVP